jgi:hypothetical protein
MVGYAGRVTRRPWHDVVYLLALSFAWYSALVLVAAFSDPAENPLTNALSMEGVLRTFASGVALVLVFVVIMVEPTKSGALKALRALLAWPVLGSCRRLVLAIIVLAVVAAALQVPVLLTRRVWIYACSGPVRVCEAKDGVCRAQILQLDAGKSGYVRVARDEALIALDPQGAIVWNGSADHASYVAPDVPAAACRSATYEYACASTTLTAFITNDSDSVLTLLGFALEPVYEAVYPLTTATVTAAASLPPLVITVGRPISEPQGEFTQIEVKAREKGLVKVPLQITRAIDKAHYVTASYICVRYSLSGKPACSSERLLMITTSPTQTACSMVVLSELQAKAQQRLLGAQVMDSLDELAALAAAEPAQTEALLLRALASAGADDVGVRLEVLNALAYTKGEASLQALRQAANDESRHSSERFAALGALTRRDKTLSKADVLSQWARNGNAGLASRAIEHIPAERRAEVCAARLARGDCDDGMLAMQCQGLGDDRTNAALAQWQKHCARR